MWNYPSRKRPKRLVVQLGDVNQELNGINNPSTQRPKRPCNIVKNIASESTTVYVVANY